ncbi:MAG: LysR family transcriptional regulator, partial [Acidimicrobiales bacterium]
MTLTQLEAFVLVARLGSVKAAARALGVPAVSGALAALRLQLGDPLVARHGNAMTLTPGGQRVVGIASQMVNLAAEAESAAGGERRAGAPAGGGDRDGGRVRGPAVACGVRRPDVVGDDDGRRVGGGGGGGP